MVNECSYRDAICIIIYLERKTNTCMSEQTGLLLHLFAFNGVSSQPVKRSIKLDMNLMWGSGLSLWKCWHFSQMENYGSISRVSEIKIKTYNNRNEKKAKMSFAGNCYRRLSTITLRQNRAGGFAWAGLILLWKIVKRLKLKKNTIIFQAKAGKINPPCPKSLLKDKA